jgi:chromosome segregation ATPase
MLQGETDGLATFKAEALTEYFERVSGSIRYATEHTELRERLTHI